MSFVANESLREKGCSYDETLELINVFTYLGCEVTRMAKTAIFYKLANFIGICGVIRST